MKKVSAMNYSDLIEQIFGKKFKSIPQECCIQNHIVAALSNTNNFKNFKKEFKNRLIRLKDHFSSNPNNLKIIKDLIVKVANDKNWRGAYAELVAYDFFIKNSDYTINLDITLPATESFAKEFGQRKDTNLDGCIDELYLYFDVKVLQDIPMNILNGIFDDVRKRINKNFTIIPEYDKSINFSIFQQNHNQLLEELVSTLKIEETTFIKSKVIDGLSYRLNFRGGTAIGTSEYSPYRHAQELSGHFFEYGNKFLKKEKTLLVFVILPWFNSLITNFNDSNRIFYRSISRRFFCQFMHTKKMYKIINPKFKGNDTCFEITKKLSGILFLEDNIVAGSGINAFLYSNPNAQNPLDARIEDYFYIHNLSAYDNFYYDNY